MITATQSHLRTELEERRERLHEALHSPTADASLSQLLTAVDAALGRIGHGTFGLCETCHESIEPDRLLADPLVQFCLTISHRTNSGPWRVIFRSLLASSAAYCHYRVCRRRAGRCGITISLPEW
jgi:hypothetical protein